MQESGAHFASTEGATTPETLRYQGLCADGTLESSGTITPLTEGTSVVFYINISGITDRGGFPAPAGRLELCVIYG